jgi:hypothetical protein
MIFRTLVPSWLLRAATTAPGDLPVNPSANFTLLCNSAQLFSVPPRDFRVFAFFPNEDPLRPRGLGHLPRWKRGRGRWDPPRRDGLPGGLPGT